MRSFVVATAGHVDHGKSALVRALTGIEPDRWEAERRRGLTIDLGFAWTTIDVGGTEAEVAFVDVPGHERFLGNMLSGLGPAPVVCFVVAADEGWSAQSSDHRDAIAALGINRGVIAITKTDREEADVAAVTQQVRAELRRTGLAQAPVVPVSAKTGTGLEALREALGEVLAAGALPDPEGRIRLWIDRAFSIAGAGTVVTGTLTQGTVRAGDELDLVTGRGRSRVAVRGVQHHEHEISAASPVSRIALALRGVAASEVARGDVLLTPGAWWSTRAIDVRVDLDEHGDTPRLPENVLAHLGSAAIPVRVRPLGGDGSRHARLTLSDETSPDLPLTRGDRLVLRVPGGQRPLTGALVLDADPPALTRRGDARRRAEALATDPGGPPDMRREVLRRGAVCIDHLRLLNLLEPAIPDGVLTVEGWLVAEERLDQWRRELRESVAADHARDPLAGGVTFGAIGAALDLPTPALIPMIAEQDGLEQDGRRVRIRQQTKALGPAERSVATLEARLAASPFDAPDANDLAALRLGARELAAAERAGRLLRLDGAVVLLPDAPERATRILAELPQPFTTSEARQALGVTRRVAIPLLEHLDAIGATHRIDGSHREVRSSPRHPS